MEEQIQDCLPSILVIDMDLGGIHGWELLRKAREIPQLVHVPVIAVTGMDMSDADQALALKVAGVQALLESPINEARLRLHVYEILQAQERQA
jgi:CheY-like chemotaxis protein